MMRTAHNTLLARLDKHGAFGIADVETEEYLIANGYTRYTQRPLMLLTARGVEYARRHARWVKNQRRAG
ncbi:MAG: hypothetical protein LCH99_04430 [Proteobacteria bacterium]|nr:hypothetical protein [Pseudomonadota bacterium]